MYHLVSIYVAVIFFSFCLTEDNELYSFGDNTLGCLGLEDKKISKSTTPQLICYLKDVEYMVCGETHVICKTYDDQFYSCGNNSYGQLGKRNNRSYYKFERCIDWPNNIISIKCGDAHSLLLTSEGFVYSFGNNRDGQLGINYDIKSEMENVPVLIKYIPEIQRIECGNTHSMCIDINNNLLLFGSNYYGQLGTENKKDIHAAFLCKSIPNVVDVSSGGNITFIKKEDNKIYAFGNNELLNSEIFKANTSTRTRTFIGNEDIWCSSIGKSKQKSARK